MNFNYQMRFSKTGRARFIAHLDTLSCLTRAIRRAGFELAETQGMRPKPLLSLAMPLGVGVEGEDEICDFSLKARAPLTELAKKLAGELPQGMELRSVGPSFDRTKAASRVESVSYRVELPAAPPGIAGAVAGYNSMKEFILLRKRPKGDKEVDLKKYIRSVELTGEDGAAANGAVPSLRFDMRVTTEGTGRPEEIVRALGSICGEEISAGRIVRTAIRVEEEPHPGARRPGMRTRPPARRRPRGKR